LIKCTSCSVARRSIFVNYEPERQYVRL